MTGAMIARGSRQVEKAKDERRNKVIGLVVRASRTTLRLRDQRVTRPRSARSHQRAR